MSRRIPRHPSRHHHGAQRHTVTIREGVTRTHPETGEELTAVQPLDRSAADALYWWVNAAGEKFGPFDDDDQYHVIIDTSRSIVD